MAKVAGKTCKNAKNVEKTVKNKKRVIIKAKGTY